MYHSLLVKSIVLYLLIISILKSDGGQPLLREYKICNGGRCTNIEANSSPAQLMEMNSLLYTNWSRWSPCTRSCKTSRYRVCKYSIICGSTSIQEDAFCYHRNTFCEEIYIKKFLVENSQEDFERERTDNNEDYENYALDYDNNYNSPRTWTNSNSNPFRGNEVNECGAFSNGNNAQGLMTKILGGQDSQSGSWPWTVAILNRFKEVYCAGTLISPRWIVTAAHCVRRRMRVTIGEHNLHKYEGNEKHYTIKASFIHAEFDPVTVDNDIALLLLPVPVEFPNIACLPFQNEPLPPPQTMCTILGWGKSKTTHVLGSPVLQEGQVPIVSMNECRSVYGRYEITENMICAGNFNMKIDSCSGDSGGPLVCNNNNRWTLYGITSQGEGCGRRGKYGIYVRVSNYVSWIQKVIKANEI